MSEPICDAQRWSPKKVWRSFRSEFLGSERRQRKEVATSVRHGGTRLLFPVDPNLSKTKARLQQFLPPSERPGIIYTTEFIRDCEELIWNHDKATPYRSETNRIAERAVNEGTTSVLL